MCINCLPPAFLVGISAGVYCYLKSKLASRKDMKFNPFITISNMLKTKKEKPNNLLDKLLKYVSDDILCFSDKSVFIGTDVWNILPSGLKTEFIIRDGVYFINDGYYFNWSKVRPSIRKSLKTCPNRPYIYVVEWQNRGDEARALICITKEMLKTYEKDIKEVDKIINSCYDVVIKY